MCGRYAASARPDELLEEFEIEDDETGGALAPDYNVAPTKQAPVILTRVPSSRRHDSTAQPVRQLRLLTWGLVPSWSKTRADGAKLINARVESLFDKPAYRRAATARRAIIPADGWYEWRREPGTTRGPKQPFFITRRDGERVALAGLYEFWRNPAAAPDDPQAWLTTFAVITTAAEAGLQHIHERMPVVLDREAFAAWLDPALTDPGEVVALLDPADPRRFTAMPVSALVSNAANNGPELVRPLDGPDGLVDVTTGEIVDEPLPGF